MDRYEVVRSRRRTLAVEVRRDGAVVVRAPLHVPEREIAHFVSSQTAWIDRARSRQALRREAHPEPDAARCAELEAQARDEIPRRVARYAERMGLRPTGIRITAARTRFGSCSAKNRLCFSWRLMDYPDAVIDYVVVHELAHIVHKNHGPRFWELVERYMPDYKRRRAMLRE